MFRMGVTGPAVVVTVGGFHGSGVVLAGRGGRCWGQVGAVSRSSLLIAVVARLAQGWWLA